MSAGKIVLGAAAGLAIGAALGLLFAPDKGTNTRKKLTEKGNGFASGFKEKYNGAIDSITSKLDGIQSKGENLYEEGRDIRQDISTTV